MHLLSRTAVLRSDVPQGRETAMRDVPYRLAQRTYSVMLRHRLLTVLGAAFGGGLASFVFFLTFYTMHAYEGMNFVAALYWIIGGAFAGSVIAAVVAIGFAVLERP
jgi:hypothetical protein